MMVIMALVKYMIKSILNYLKYSDVNIQLSFNPVWWRLEFEYLHNPSGFDFKMHSVLIRLLMFKIVIVIDDGSW